MKCSKCLCSAEETRKYKQVEMCWTCIKEEMDKIKTYDLTVRFTTDRELTEDEKGTLQHQVIAQIEEPVTADGEDVTFTTEFYGSDIDEVEGK